MSIKPLDMGICISSSSAVHEIRECISKKFDSFDYRINSTDEFTFTQRARRELTGHNASDDFMNILYKGFRAFIIEAAVEIALSTKSEVKGKFITTITPPPLIDEMWCLAILYSKKYQELCKYLVGGTIDRVPYQKLKRFDLFKTVWPDYDVKLWEIDTFYTVWIYNKHINFFLKEFFNTVFRMQKNDEIELFREDLDYYLGQFHKGFTTVYSNINLTRENVDIPETHENFNPQAKGICSEVYEKILALIPEDLEILMQDKYGVGNNARVYIEEYARFMTLIYFSKNVLTPSEETDQVWHLHQFFTIDYREFCDNVYGRFIHHTPTTGGRAEDAKHVNLYMKTLEFYRFMFKQAPPIGIWPSNEDRFKPCNFLGSWYSLLRILQSSLKVIEKHRLNIPSNIPLEMMKCYFTWTGANLFKSKSYKITLTPKDSSKTCCSCESYWCQPSCKELKSS